MAARPGKPQCRAGPASLLAGGQGGSRGGKGLLSVIDSQFPSVMKYAASSCSSSYS